MITLILTALLTAEPTPIPRECGKGPVEIRVSIGDCCGCPPPPRSLTHAGGDLYRESETNYAIAICCGCPVLNERWTDWPECGGKEMRQ